MTRVKVCGVRSKEDAQMCYRESVDAIGFVYAPGRKRSIPLSEIRYIISRLPLGVSSTLITLDEDVNDVLEQASLTQPDTVQTYALGPKDIKRVKEHGYGVIRAVTVDADSGEPEIRGEELSEVSRAADLVLFEPSANGRSGGLGLKFETFSGLSKLLPGCPRFGIAGGLDPDNVRDALELAPVMVDVSSGVESPDGNKDQKLVRKFVRRCRQ